AGTRPGGIVRVDYFLRRLAARDAAGDLKRVRELDRCVGAQPIPARRDTEKALHRVGEFVSTPLRIVRAGFVNVTDGDGLYVRFRQKVKHDAHALRRDANKGEIDLVAGGHIAEAAKDAAWHDRKASRSHGSLAEKFAAGDGFWRRVLLRL